MTKNDTSVGSPCIGLCQYNEEEYCEGCFRSYKEISEWAMMSNEEKAKVIDIIPSRMKQSL